MDENWKEIDSTDGEYLVSDHGRVKNRTGKIKTTYFSGDGYPMVCLGKKRRLIHRLVLETFCGPCPPKNECHHKDGTRSNNHIDNLVWVTHRQNMQEAHKVRGHRVVTETEAKYILSSWGQKGKGHKKIGKELGISHKLVQRIRSGNRWRDFERANLANGCDSVRSL